MLGSSCDRRAGALWPSIRRSPTNYRIGQGSRAQRSTRANKPMQRLFPRPAWRLNLCSRANWPLATLGAWLLIAMSSLASAEDLGRKSPLLFTSQGKTGVANVDDLSVRYLDFAAPNQATWQPGPAFDDGHSFVVLSMEPRRDGPGRPFEEYYTQTPTRLWRYDLISNQLDELLTRDRLAPFITPQLLLGGDQLLVQVVRDRVGQIFRMGLDGSEAEPFTHAGEGLPYGLSLSPDGLRVGFHLASSAGYQIWTSDTRGADRVKVAAQPGHLYFGTSWSPDGQWILYVDCHAGDDPGHDWADVCIGRADGSQHRVLTTGQAMWFAATYGNRETRGGGSNVPQWTRDGKIVYPRRTPNAKVAWEYQPQRPDTDHFNREFKPELARGGAEICLLDPISGSESVLIRSDPPTWNFRAIESPDGDWIAFCRAETAGPSAIWLFDRNSGDARMVTTGINERGADHPRWLAPRR